jgi:2-oxoglutarate ferredoxin oxidoreductase subunit alpha
MNDQGFKNIGYAHFNYINPLPKNTEAVLKQFKKIVVCELNTGQFAKVLKMNFDGLTVTQFNKVQGLPFGNQELTEKFKQLLK